MEEVRWLYRISLLTWVRGVFNWEGDLDVLIIESTRVLPHVFRTFTQQRWKYSDVKDRQGGQTTPITRKPLPRPRDDTLLSPEYGGS